MYFRAISNSFEDKRVTLQNLDQLRMADFERPTTCHVNLKRTKWLGLDVPEESLRRHHDCGTFFALLNIQEETGDSRCDIDSMNISERRCHSSITSGSSLTNEKPRRLIFPTLTISGCRTSKVFPLAI
jgi:hypothetical protein